MKVRLSDISHEHHNALALHVPSGIEDVWKPIAVIHGSTRKEIALALLNNYPHRLILWGGLAAEFDAPEGVCRVLERLQSLKKPIREKDAKEVLQNPTLENVERFVALRKLLE